MIGFLVSCPGESVGSRILWSGLFRGQDQSSEIRQCWPITCLKSEPVISINHLPDNRVSLSSKHHALIQCWGQCMLLDGSDDYIAVEYTFFSGSGLARFLSLQRMSENVDLLSGFSCQVSVMTAYTSEGHASPGDPIRLPFCTRTITSLRSCKEKTLKVSTSVFNCI